MTTTTKKMPLNVRAFDLRRKLFELTNEFKALLSRVQGCDDAAIEAHTQLDRAACALATVHDELGDLFVDAARDKKDQYFAGVELS